MQTLKLNDTLTFYKDGKDYHYSVDEGNYDRYYLLGQGVYNCKIFELIGVIGFDGDYDDDVEAKKKYCEKIIGKMVYEGDFPEVATLEDLTKIAESFLKYFDKVELNGKAITSSFVQVRTKKRLKISLI